jgi:hypothetical protein
MPYKLNVVLNYPILTLKGNFKMSIILKDSIACWHMKKI